jgi:hypothetical protein
MGDRKKFIPVRGLEERIMDMTGPNAMGFNDGYIYFALDTGRIYVDYTMPDGTRVARAMVGNSSGGGSGNSGIYYANKEMSDDEKLEDIIHFPMDTIEGNEYPQKDDLIINISEGSFYRVINPSPLTTSVEALRLTISGGGGGGASTLEEDIYLRIEDLTTINYINGQDAFAYFTAVSAKDKKGEPLDSTILITYTLAYTEDGGNNYISYKTGTTTVTSGVRSSFNFGKYARPSTMSRLTLKAS